MSIGIILHMVRRTITIPPDLVERIQEEAGQGESFSAAISRFARAGMEERPLEYIGVVEGVAGDDSVRVKELVAEILEGSRGANGSGEVFKRAVVGRSADLRDEAPDVHG